MAVGGDTGVTQSGTVSLAAGGEIFLTGDMTVGPGQST